MQIDIFNPLLAKLIAVNAANDIATILKVANTADLLTVTELCRKATAKLPQNTSQITITTSDLIPQSVVARAVCIVVTNQAPAELQPVQAPAELPAELQPVQATTTFEWGKQLLKTLIACVDSRRASTETYKSLVAVCTMQYPQLSTDEKWIELAKPLFGSFEDTKQALNGFYATSIKPATAEQITAFMEKQKR